MKDFVAIDFETANAKRSSVCSVGIVIVRNGLIENELYRLIHPTPNYYGRINTQIHGLTNEDTDDAPLFPEVWREIHPLIGDLPLVAHNSPFDSSCLKAAFTAYDMPYPDYPFFCTCRQARIVLGQRVPNHKLTTVAEHLGLDFKNHHHALADAEACALIALKLFNP